MNDCYRDGDRWACVVRCVEMRERVEMRESVEMRVLGHGLWTLFCLLCHDAEPRPVRSFTI